MEDAQRGGRTFDFRYAMYSSVCVGSSRRYRLYTRTAVSWGMPGCIRNFCSSIDRRLCIDSFCPAKRDCRR